MGIEHAVSGDGCFQLQEFDLVDRSELLVESFSSHFASRGACCCKRRFVKLIKAHTEQFVRRGGVTESHDL
jgi:hypothetical protein